MEKVDPPETKPALLLEAYAAGPAARGFARGARANPEARRLHPRQRWRPARVPGDDLLPAGVRRVRSRRPARGGGAGATQTIPRAVIWSAVLVGLFYVFNYYAATVYFGPDKMKDFYTFNNGDPWGFMADAVLPIGGLLVVLAILNSCLANANAGANAATRSMFAMGRATLIPQWFGAVHPTYKSPVNAVHFQAYLGLVIALALGFILAEDPFPGSGPLNDYVWLGTMIGLLFAADVHRGEPGVHRVLSARGPQRDQRPQAHRRPDPRASSRMIPAVLGRARRRDDPDPRSRAAAVRELAATTRRPSSASGW